MLLDIFSSLDYYYSKFQMFNCLKLAWVFPILLFFVNIIKYYVRAGYGFVVRIFYLNGWVVKLNSKGFLFYIVFFYFFYLCFEKLLGLFPYTFSITRHIVTKFFSAFECWLLIVLYGLSQHLLRFIGHFTPLGSPLGLSFTLKYIEWISVLIRPLTLSLRLAVNISTGHIFIRLVSTGVLISSLGLGWFILFGFFFGYILFEIFVRFIQGFVFRLLLVQYSDEL